MDAAERDPWSAPGAPVGAEAVALRPADDGPRPGRMWGMWRGAKTGFRLTSYVVAPFAGVIALAAAVPMAIGVGAGRGFATHAALLNAAKGYIGFATWGIIFGGAIGLVFGWLPARAGVLRALDRPIRLRFWRKKEAVRPAPRWPRWPWILAGLVCLVLVTAYSAGVYLGRRVDRRLARAIADAERDTPNWQIDDLLASRRLVPDEKNSALVMAEVVSLLPENWPLPPPGQPPLKTDVRKVYDGAVDGAENVRLDAATVELFQRDLHEYQDAVSLGRTVANYDRGRYELVISANPLETPLNWAAQAREVARLLSADALVRAHDGDLDGALDSCRAVIGAGRSLGDEPTMLSQLVRNAIGKVGLKTARRVLGQGEPSDEALARLQALLLDEVDEPLLLHALRGERAILNEFIRKFGSGDLPIWEAMESAAADAHGAVAPWGRLWFDNQRALGLELLNQSVAIAQLPLAERSRSWKIWDDGITRTRQNRTDLYLGLLPLHLMPDCVLASSAQTRYQIELGATAILLAAERHRRTTGAWPASADSIAPEILTDPPADPFTGRPFVFELSDGRLMVYSVGQNLRDDHGEYEPSPWPISDRDDLGVTAWDVALRRQPPP